MSALIKTIGIFEEDTRLYYVGEGLFIAKDPFDNKIKLLYKKDQEGKVERALKMSGMKVVGDVEEKRGFYIQEVEEDE